MDKKVIDLKSAGAELKKDSTKQKEAFECYYKASQLDPRDPEIWYEMGEIIDNAEINEEEYVSTQSLRDIIKPGLSYDDFDQIVCFQKTIMLDPKHIGALKRIAELFHISDDTSNAAEAFKKVIELNPNDIEALCKRASNCHSLAISGEEYSEIELKDPKMLEEAIKCYNSAIEKDPKGAADYEAFYWMAEISLLKKEKRSALMWFNKQVEYTEDNYCKKEGEKLARELGI
jgi:tetratricopeptide (TPR) repeat protein